MLQYAYTLYFVFSSTPRKITIGSLPFLRCILLHSFLLFNSTHKILWALLIGCRIRPTHTVIQLFSRFITGRCFSSSDGSEFAKSFSIGFLQQTSSSQHCGFSASTSVLHSVHLKNREYINSITSIRLFAYVFRYV